MSLNLKVGSAVSRFAPGLALVLAVAGCTPQQTLVAERPVVQQDPLAGAQAKLAAGDFAAAAAEYARLGNAGTDAPAERARLTAALIAADLDPAAAITLPPQVPTDPVAARLHGLLAAARQEQAGDFAGALTRLSALGTGDSTPYVRGLSLRLKGRAALQAARWGEAAGALLGAEAVPLPPARRGELTQAIWNTLNHVQDPDPAAVAATGSPHAAGWLALLEIYRKQAGDAAAFGAAIDAWQKQYSNHPANELLIGELVEQSERQLATPRQIALLLPFEGQLAGLSEAIRDGFLAAWYADPRGPSRPPVALYPTTPAGINQTFDKAVAEGANLVVGPLEKAAVEALAKRANRGVPVLALNTSDQGAQGEGAALYQFSLRPEDEAAAAAQRAHADGLSHAVAIVPANSWGDRVAGAFAKQWQADGGKLLGTIRFSQEVEGYAAAVKQIFGVDESEARAAALRRITQRKIEFQPRRRNDVDAIFLAAYPIDARQILPQLRYFHANDVPVYATSNVFTGNVNASADQDLDGVSFADMPWLFARGSERLKATVDAVWRDRQREYARLFAFGIDAYRLLPYLAQLKTQPGMRLAGTTGQLWMDTGGGVHRDPIWARFRGGVPEELGAGPPVSSQ